MKKNINKHLEHKINSEFNSRELKEKYFELIEKRIEENSKNFKTIFTFIILTIASFYFLKISKVTSVNFGLISINDPKSLEKFLPMIFSLLYFKYLLIWYELIDQKRIYSILSSQLLELNNKSILLEKVLPFGITKSLDKLFSPINQDLSGCLTILLFIPSLLILAIFPFLIQIYFIYELLFNQSLNSIIDKTVVVIPITVFIYSIITVKKYLNRKVK